MTWYNITTSIITLLSIFAAILAWLTKLKWSAEYSKAKDEIIKAKDAKITLLEGTIQIYKDEANSSNK